MRIRQASIAAGLIYITALAAPVMAQSFEQQMVQCRNAGVQFAPAVQVAACTALLQSRRFNSESLSAIHLSRGVAHAIQNDLDRAIADFDEAIRLNPQHANAFNNRGNVFRAQNDHARAMSDYNEAIRLNPQFAVAFNNRGNVYTAQNDHARAMSDYNEAIRLNPQFAGAYESRALAHERLGDAARAAADRAEAARLRGR